MSRETVRMVREGVRPPFVDPFAEERAVYEARIAELKQALWAAKRALARLLASGDDGLGFLPWVEDGDEEGGS